MLPSAGCRKKILKNDTLSLFDFGIEELATIEREYDLVVAEETRLKTLSITRKAYKFSSRLDCNHDV